MAAKDNFFSPKKTLNIKGKIIELNTPQIMGIINTTPDSFFINSRKKSIKEISHAVESMLNDGANIIDLGAFSTRPNHEVISEEEEWTRLQPGLTTIRKDFPDCIISVDTFRSSIARKVIDNGADIINDISGGLGDIDMFKEISQQKVPYIMMHIKGNPVTMHQPQKYENLIKEIAIFFDQQIKKLNSLGHNDIIIDPGIGFSKTIPQNYEILKNLDYFKVFKLPILIGVSRKSLIYKILQTSPEEALNGTTVLNTIAILKGANILRVHDPKEAKEVIELIKQLPG